METTLITPCYPDLAGKTAVVTGGSRGIGAEVCRALARAGTRVGVVGRDAAAVSAVLRDIASVGETGTALIADCTDPTALRNARELAERELGPADLLLAFAGGNGDPAVTWETTAERWRAVVEANLTATFLTLKEFLPGMVARRRGAVVTMASSAARLPSQASAAYAAAKAGVVMLTRHLAAEVGPHGVRVNCVAPSAVRTDRLAAMPADQLARIGANFPLGRVGEPADVAAATLFLCSAAAGWVTGVTLDVAGGKVIL
jgi:3-oxoacyl-[acyl-carrier protein] reductase